ncbi:MAG: DUF2723 domain-containing protein [Caldilineaceae bacterium]|nr:DUF2723 domain-containing protein [Caldilineaceae bacterium]
MNDDTAMFGASKGDKLRRWPLLLFLVLALLLYLLTLDNGFLPRELEGGDLITHQYAQVQARPSNAPGYPLYTMGGWLWFHGLRGLLRLAGEPLPNPIPLLSSYSTLWAIVALWLFYLVLYRLSQGRWWLAWLISAFYAVTYFFWYYATTTEQYSSAVAQTLAIVYFYLRWRQGHATANGAFYVMVLLCGMALAHMLTVALIVPPLVLVVLWQSPQLLRRARTVVGAVLVALLPLTSYLYVYVRGAAHPEWWGRGDWHTASQWFWSFLSTAQGREELSWGLEAGRPFWGGGFPQMMWQELSIPLFALGLLGILFLGRRMAVLLYGTLFLYAAFCWAYRFGNWYQVILPAYPLILLGLTGWSQLLDRRLSAPANRYVQAAAALLLCVAIGWRAQSSWPAADSRNRPDDTALPHAGMLIAQPLPSAAALFAPVQDALALQYLIDIWHIRPDLRVVSSRQAAAILQENGLLLTTVEAAPTLLDELPAPLAVQLQDQSADWVRVNNAAHPGAMEAPAVVLDEAALSGVVLAGYSFAPTPVNPIAPQSASPAMDLMLYWQLADGVWPEGVSISVRPTLNGKLIRVPQGAPNQGESNQGESNQIVQQDRPRPVHGLAKLSAPFLQQQLVADAYRLALAEPAPAGVDGVSVILYQKKDGGFENVAELAFPLDMRGP